MTSVIVISGSTMGLLTWWQNRKRNKALEGQAKAQMREAKAQERMAKVQEREEKLREKEAKRKH